MELTKECKLCKKVFERSKYTSYKEWGTKRFCSKKCWYSYRKEFKPYASPLKGRTKENCESIRMISEKMKGNQNMQNYLKGGGKHPMKGLKQSEEWGENISKANKGKKHWNWQEGKTDGTQLLRQHREYQQWRIKCLERDQYTCQHCGSTTDYQMAVHHIKGFKEYPELGYEPSNGITICNSCHMKLHARERSSKNHSQ